MHPSKRLTQALILSVTLNIGLIATFTYFVIQERQTSIPIEMAPAQAQANAQVPCNDDLLSAYSQLSFAELLLRLESQDLIENGFKKRDLALACLVAFHHFNLPAALGGLSVQKRDVRFTNRSGASEEIILTLFPGLSDAQYQAIVRYAETEKWPLTSQGLFFEIKRASSPRDSTLLEAFFHTSEFQAVSLLFSRTGVALKNDALIDMLAQGDWALLHDFSEKQKLAQDLSIDQKRALLLSYLEVRSPLAAEILLESDFEFISRRMSDEQLMVLFDLAPKGAKLDALAKELLGSPRSDAVWKRAALAQTQAQTQLPVSTVALTREPTSQKRIHVIQKGDSLWKIAKQYKVSVKEIVRVNKIENESLLRPGKTLEIP